MDKPEAASWRDPDPSSPLPFWSSLHADILAHRFMGAPFRSSWERLRFYFIVSLTSPGLHAMLLYRLTHSLAGHLGRPGRILAALLYRLARLWYGCEFPPSARLFGGLILPHPQGIIISPGTTVGPRSWIFHNATLGGAPRKQGSPTVGKGARIFVGAVVSGPIRLGDRVAVGANTVVTRDVPDDTVIRQDKPVMVSLARRRSARPKGAGPRPG